MQRIWCSVLVQTRVNIWVVSSLPAVGFLGGSSEHLLGLGCGSKRCVALHTNRLWWPSWRLSGTSYSGDVKGTLDI
uniref:Secreted protein n=1 Tax=Brassica campestris TaxID=3711 RepID=A0A3P6BVG6_BRACM|nr:unnamed protein product [Brassica rapa]